MFQGICYRINVCGYGWPFDDLQVCKFKSNQLLKLPPDASSVCDTSQDECDDLSSDFGEEFEEEDGDASEVLLVDSYPDLSGPRATGMMTVPLLIWVLFVLAIDK